jgi:hypothetical protein
LSDLTIATIQGTAMFPSAEKPKLLLGLNAKVATKLQRRKEMTTSESRNWKAWVSEWNSLHALKTKERVLPTTTKSTALHVTTAK